LMSASQAAAYQAFMGKEGAMGCLLQWIQDVYRNGVEVAIASKIR
jgi:hypothetical protein